ncbi:hypothetical protein KEM52_005827 [Ascosphaera acerosa]|nr:hypothetical protein KEM52_005827 [Ascosphaera acerosa]
MQKNGKNCVKGLGARPPLLVQQADADDATPLPISQCWARLDCSFLDIEAMPGPEKLAFAQYLAIERLTQLDCADQLGAVQGMHRFLIGKRLDQPKTYLSFLASALLEAVQRGAAIALGVSRATGGNPASQKWAKFFIQYQRGQLDDRNIHDAAWARAEQTALEYGMLLAEALPGVERPTPRITRFVKMSSLYRTIMIYRRTILWMVKVSFAFTNPSVAFTFEELLDWFTDITHPDSVEFLSEVAWAISAMTFADDDGAEDPLGDAEVVLRAINEIWVGFQRHGGGGGRAARGGKEDSTRARGNDEDTSEAAEAQGTVSVPMPIPLSPVQLRDYQEKCIQAVLASVSQGRRRLGVSLATGSGKTVIFTQLIDRVAPPAANAAATRTLILVHRKELVEQAARHCLRAYPGKTIEIEMASSHASGTADITIASVKSMLSKNRMLKYDPATFKLVLVDEAHHIVARSYRTVLAHFGLCETPLPAHVPVLVGVSATFSRFDGLKLGALIDYIVYHKDYIDMIKDRWLADATFTTVKSYADLSRVGKASNGDFSLPELSLAVNTKTVNDIIVRTWLSKAAGKRRSTIVFGVDIEHVRSLTEAFRQHGVDARCITSKTDREARTAGLDAFRNLEYPVLVNCGLFTEGTDIPNIDCVILARPTRSRNLLVQMIGRGLRLHPGKENCHILDVVGSLETGIVTTPTLFGLHPDEGLDEASITAIQDLKDGKDGKDGRGEEDSGGRERASKGGRTIPLSRISVEVTDYDTVHDLLADASAEKHIRQLSDLAWVSVSKGRYILETKSGRVIISKAADNDYRVHYCMALNLNATQPAAAGSKKKAQSPWGSLREIASAPGLEEAVRAADTFANRTFPHVFIHRSQPWRHYRASPSQLRYLNARLPPAGDGGAELTPGNTTKGEAADMIVKIKNGALGEFARLAAQKRKAVRAQHREDALRQREAVRVGPLNDVPVAA